MGKQAYFSKGELILWGASVGMILVSFFFVGGGSGLTLAASLVGACALIFNAKGNPLGQALTVVFSLLYGVISWSFAYYGEMVTYLGMTMPMAVAALVAWLRNPYQGDRAQVKVGKLQGWEYWLLPLLTGLVTWGFYYILRYFHTANLLPSTISVTTSFLAVYLTFRRSPFFALAYAANDIVLIVLWVLAAWEDAGYWSVAVCFGMFLVNDLYGFWGWNRMKRRQEEKGRG